MHRMDVTRPALAAWMLLAVPAMAQTSAPSGNPQQDLAGAPEPGLGITYGGEIDSKVQIDGRFNRTRSGYAELYAKSVGAAYVNLGSAVSFRAEGTYERFRNQTATTAFNSEGLYLSQLYGTYAPGLVTAYAGKIHPRFSVGYERVPGIYDTFANDYKQKERIGVGALVNVLPGLDTSPRRASGNAARAERTPATRVSRRSIQNVDHTAQHSGTHNCQQPLSVCPGSCH